MAHSLRSSIKSTLSTVTRLDSGITVASVPASSHFAAVGVYVDAGAVYETSEDRGASRFVSNLAFKSTQRQSESEVVQSVAELGGNLFCNANRESIIYQGSVLCHQVPNALRLLSDVILRPNYTSSEIDQTRHVLADEGQRTMNQPDAYISELLHAVAYGGQGLGNSIMCDPQTAQNMNENVIRQYAKRFLHPSRMVVAGAGIQHNQLCEWVTKYFTTTNSPDLSIPKQQSIGSEYNGGTHQLVIPKPPPTHTNYEQPLTHVQVAFPVPIFTHPDMYPLSTLQVLMGGGGAFSAGGPGKGMYSRLYTNVLNRYQWMDSCVSFQHAYSKSCSLWGLSASCVPEFNPHLVNVLAGEIVQLTQDFDQEEINRAKNQLKSSLMMNLESMVITVEDLGRQVLAQQHRIDPMVLIERIDAVTKDDLIRVASTAINKVPTTVVVGENLKDLGDFTSALSAFKSGTTRPTNRKRFWS